MIRNIQKLFRITGSLVIGSLILMNCEPDADQLGSQFFQNGADGTEQAYPLIAYNVNNNDSIRTDAARLQSATLGAFSEPQFGMQKSAYVSQFRLSSPDPVFGDNAALDSAVLVIRPQYLVDSVKTTTNEDYVFPQGEVPAKKVVNTYPVVKYGKKNSLLNLKVEEVSEFLGGASTQIRSTRNVATSTVLGNFTFKGKVSDIKITKDSDNSELFVRDAAIRIPLDSAFFASKIIAKAGAPELADAASFIRYFKGIKISVAENDGYLFNFDPNKVEINLYYKRDKVENNVTTREPAVFNLFSGGENVRFNSITYDRSGSPAAAALASASAQDSLTGVPKLYAQGMGGPGFALKVPDATIAEIRSKFANEKIGIISARLRVYTDPENWNNDYRKPASFVVKQKVKGVDLNTFLQDMSALYGTGVYNLIKAYDLEKNPAYYDIGITQTLKNVIELGNPTTAHFVVNVGAYTTDAAGTLVGSLNSSGGAQNYNTRSYTPQRAVLIGTDPGNERSAKLILTYGKKQQ